MAKTESTAVNQLIANIQGKPLNPDDHWDSDDLGLEERTNPTHEPVRKPSAPAVARTTASAPTMAPAMAPPPPMPRSRSASGTEIPPMNATARTSVARATTIPPIPAAAMNPRATMTGVPGGPTRSSTLPPPLRNSAPGVRVPDGTPAPELRPSGPKVEAAPAWGTAPAVPAVAHGTIPPTGAYPPPPADLAPSAYPPPPADLAPSAYPPPPADLAPSYPPPPAPSLPGLPIAAPAPAPAPAPLSAAMPALPRPPMPAPGKPLDATTDWFLESSQAVPTLDEADIGTMGVAAKKPRLGFLIGAALVCAIGGVFVGGYLVFDGAGNKATAQSATPSLQAEAKAAEQKAAAAFTGVGGRKHAADPSAPAAEPSAPAAEPAADPAAANPQPEPAPAVAATAPAPAPAPAPEVKQPEPTPAPAVAATTTRPAPAPAPAPGTTDTAPAAPALVDVLFLSKPSGADVVLVDNGKTIPIGTTPVSASIDVSRTYEAVFALEGHKTRIAQLDPRHDRKFTIDLESGKTKVKHGEVKVAAAPKVDAPKADTHKTTTEKKDRKADKAKVASVDFDTKPAAATTPDPKPDPKPVAKPDPKPAKTADVAASGTGVLMIASKPPCEITIDGKSTGLTTPQRSIELAAGTHKVTLVNTDANIKKTIAVKITAGKPTKLMQDYTSELK